MNGKNIYYYNVPSIVKGETTNITEVDLRKIAEILDNILFKKYPLIETFFNYIKNILISIQCKIKFRPHK